MLKPSLAILLGLSLVAFAAALLADPPARPPVKPRIQPRLHTFTPPRPNSANDSLYTAVFSDGSRVTGARLTNWGQQDRPDLNGDPLFGRRNFVRWLKQETAKQPTVPPAFVEMVGGDLLPGRVVGVGESQSLQEGTLGPHLLVEPAVSMVLPGVEVPHGPLRVSTRWLRRIVWQRRGSDRYQPGTLFYKDGRQISFRLLRFVPQGVSVLTDNDRREAKLADLAEIDMPPQDWWNAYFEQVALLTPDCGQRLMQLETLDGLRATITPDRLQPFSWPNPMMAEFWYHAIQPAWSLDTLFVRHTRIVMRRFFGAHEVPLSIVEPSAVRLHSALAVGWRPRADRNVQGGPLVNGGKEYGWGWGMHAYTEMDFPLPACALSFRSRVGLDRVVGEGGCARGLVYIDAPRGEPIFGSDHLIGSEKGEETGVLSLEPAPDGSSKLVLVAHPDSANPPPGADPLDIRDVVDWLEPQLNLDLAKVRGEVHRRLLAELPAMEGWTIPAGGDDSLVFGSRMDLSDQRNLRFHFEFRPRTADVALRRSLHVGPDQNWLLLYVSRSDNGPPDAVTPSQAVVRIDDKQVGTFEVPARRGPNDQDPLMVSLENYHNRDVTVEVRLVSRGDKSFVDWKSSAVLDRSPTLFELFENSAKPPVRLSGQAEVTGDDRYSGVACIKVSGEGAKGALGNVNLPIRQNPRFGEYRYLCFAWRKSGGRQIALDVNFVPGADANAAGPAARRRYFAGPEPETTGDVRTHRLAERQPDSWMLVKLDLFQDIGEGQLTGLTLHCPDGDYALLDHVYLARSDADFARCPPARPGEGGR